jgi:hypothetical protein
MTQDSAISLDSALKAQKALRDAAGLQEETFAVQEFVGMISDEIQQLREQGRSDEQIASIIAKNSPIEISAEEITQNYATPEQRHPHGG